MLQQNTPALQSFVNRLASRSVLTESEVDAVLALPTRTMEVRPNHDFVRLDERVDQTCLVVAGLVGRFDLNAKGARQITALHLAGDMTDLHSVVQPKATSALQALTTTTILKVPHRALREVAAAYPAIAEALWRDTMVDSMILAQWVVNVGRRDATSRIAHLLCEMACRYGVGSAGAVVFRLPMTQQQLADATGLTSIHVNRCLKKLTGAGVSFHHRSVRIQSWQALVAIGDFDRGYLQDEMLPEDRIRIAPIAA